MLDCDIISPENITSFKELKSVRVPAYRGEAQILPGHAESFMMLKTGQITLEKNGTKKDVIDIQGGECHVLNDTVKIIL